MTRMKEKGIVKKLCPDRSRELNEMMGGKEGTITEDTEVRYE